MLTPTLLAALLVAAPTAFAQDVTSSFTRCTTRFGFYPLPTGSAGIPTYYEFTTTTNTLIISSTTRDTFTVTPTATTSTGILTTTTTLSTTTTLTPAAITIPTPASFLPLILADLPDATPAPRYRRFQVAPREVLHPLKRQTPAENTGGFIVRPDGTTSNLNRIFPHRVLCQVRVTINSTRTSVVTAEPITFTAPQSVATAISTDIVTVTTTITEIRPTPTVYAACAGNNVVDHITDRDRNRMNFDRVVYRPQEGFPIANELVANTTTATNCCIACQNTPTCAGSFYVPSRSECHLRLTVAANLGNSTIQVPSVTGTGTVALATGAPVKLPAKCPLGSNTLYLGTIRGQEPNLFPSKYALSFSNGPCGRFTISPIRVAVIDDAADD